MSNVVTESNRKEYLGSKTWMFKSGFLAAEDMNSDKGRDTQIHLVRTSGTLGMKLL